MKESKIMIIVLTVGMYLSIAPLLISLLLIYNETTNGYAEIFFKASPFFLLIDVPLVIASFVIAIKGLFKDQESPLEMLGVMKHAQMIFYVLNFFLCSIVASAMLNPFLFLATPIVVGLMVSGTYLLMISNSILGVSYVIRGIIKGRTKVTAKVVIGIILSFVFVLDVVGTYMLINECCE